MLSDTSGKAEEKHIELLRKAGFQKRLTMACALTRTVMNLSWRAIQRKNKDLSDREIDLRFAELHYGSGLASKLRNYLEKQAK